MNGEGPMWDLLLYLQHNEIVLTPSYVRTHNETLDNYTTTYLMRLTQNDKKYICEHCECVCVQESKRNNKRNAKYWIVETERQKWKYCEEQKQTHPNKQIPESNPAKKKKRGTNWDLSQKLLFLSFFCFFHAVILLYSLYLHFVFRLKFYTFYMCFVSHSYSLSFHSIFDLVTLHFCRYCFTEFHLTLCKSDWVGRFLAFHPLLSVWVFLV